MGIPNDTQQIHKRNPIFPNLGAEAVIPAEVNLCSAQVDGFDPTQNELMMVERLDLLEEY